MPLASLSSGLTRLAIAGVTAKLCSGGAKRAVHEPPLRGTETRSGWGGS
jgi:hypothetical protein